MLVKVWCEYDISGQFGGNNNEEVITLTGNIRSHNGINYELITDKIQDYLCVITGLSADELVDLWGWEIINSKWIDV